MSNRFHNKFHRHNHHSVPTDRGGLYPDSAFDPIASKESPFRGDFYLSGNFIGFQNCYISQNLSADNIRCNNLTVVGQTTQLDTFVYATSAVTITNTGTYTGLTVLQDGMYPIAHFIDNDGGNHIIFDQDGKVGIGTTSPEFQLHVKNTKVTGNTNDTSMILSESVNRWGMVRLKGLSGGQVQFTDQYNNTYGSIIGVPSVSAISFTTKVGIGTLDPTGLSSPLSAEGKSLHVYNSINDNTAINSNTVVVAESVNRNAYFLAAVGPIGTGGLTVKSSSNAKHLGRVVVDYTGSTLFQAGDGEYGLKETMRILSGGFVGIGTSTPESLLHLNRSSASDGAPLSSVGFRITNSIEHRGAHSFIQLGNGTSGYAMYWEPVVKKLRFNYDESVGTASTRIMTMLSSGYVGIGTVEPNYHLTVVGDVSATGKMFIGSDSGAFNGERATLTVSQSGIETPSVGGLKGININNTCNTAEAKIGIIFTAFDDGNTRRHGASIVSGKEKNWVFDSLDYPGYLSFWTRQGNSTEQFERMRINSGGDVGIGTSTPGVKLDVAGQVKGTALVGALIANSNTADQTSIILSRQGAPANQKSWEIVHLNSDANGRLTIRSVNDDYTQEDVAIAAWRNPSDWGINRLTFGANFGTRMTVASSGYVGIGTESPVTPLEVVGDVTFGRSIYTGNSISTEDTSIEVGLGRTGQGNAYIDLHAVPGTDYEARFIRVGGTNGNAGLLNTGTGDFNIFQEGLGPIIIGTANTERMRFTAGGNIGIGITNPNEKLTVIGNIEAYSEDYSNSTIIRARSAYNNAVLQLDNLYTSAGSGPLINFQFNTKSFARIRGNTSLSALSFETDDIERIRVTKDGKVGIGTTAPNKTLTVVGEISASQEIFASRGTSENWTSAYTTVKENSAVWSGVELIGRTAQVPIRASTTLEINYTDIELVPDGSTITTEISAFTNGLRGITYTITNKTGYKVNIFASPKLIIRRGNSWRSNTTSMSGAFLTLPLSGSCSLRADTSTTFSVW